MPNSEPRNRAVATLSGVALALTSLQAIAQTPPAAAAATEELQEVVVTGSRIQNSGLISPTPLTVLSAEQFLQTTPSAVDDILTQLPAFRASSGPNQNTRNAGIQSGQSFADLRGLGAQRTLLLVNGQRWVPTNSNGTTGTAVIPVDLIERMEVVTGGASAAYGSDAVAGVTNIILKDRIQGLRFSAFGGQSSHSDNKEVGLGIATGFAAFDNRMHVVLGANYNNNKGVGNIYSREWSAVEPGNSGNPLAFGATRSAGTPAFGWANGVEYAAQTPGGVITGATTAGGAASTTLNSLAFLPNGSTFTLQRGTVFGNLMVNSSSNPIATPLAQWLMKAPLKQHNAFGRMTFDISPTTQAYAQMGFAGSYVFSQSQYHQSPTITILATNPYLPAALKTQMQQLGLASFNMGRVDTEWFGTTANNFLHASQFATGIKSAWGEFKWDLGLNYGTSRVDVRTYGTREANLYAADYAVLDSSGNIVCGPVASNPNFAASRLTNSVQVANVLPGCVPMNPFGAGNASQAARDYVAGLEYTTVDSKRTDVAFNVSGPLFHMPAGAVSGAAGVEYRKDDLQQIADPLQIQGLYSAGNARSYSGNSKVTEGYVEVEVPLLKDVAFAKSLGLSGAARRTHYDLSGNVTTWKLGATWQPLESLRFRVTRSRDIRAPSLSDLYSVGGVSATGSFVNPFNGLSARLPVQATGNPNLVPERADTTSYGMTFNSRDGALAGLRFSADYYHIKVSDVIAAVGATDILQRCYQGITSYCPAIVFDSSAFGIAKVNTQSFNQALLDNQGVDLELGYNAGLGALHLPGSLDFSLFATRLLHSKSTDRPGPLGVTIENAGTQAAQAYWTGSVFMSYRLESLSVGVQTRFFTSVRYSALNIGPGETGYDPSLANSINKNIFGGMSYFNLNGSYDIKRGARKFQVFANVNNLFDRHPPDFAIAAINLGGNPYDYVGRTYKLGIRVEL